MAKIFWTPILVVSVVCLIGCAGQSDLKAFTSDGCTLFPDKSKIMKQDWCECCFEHDLAYWKGGTKEERLLADLKLRECVLKKTGDQRLADIMYEGVRLGGSPYFYNWYRWGYGWSYDRKYSALTKEETALVAKRLQEYHESQPISPCSDE